MDLMKFGNTLLLVKVYRNTYAFDEREFFYNFYLLNFICFNGRESNLLSSFPQMPGAPEAKPAQILQLIIHSRSSVWVPGTQVPELSPAASQGAHEHKAEVGSRAGT